MTSGHYKILVVDDEQDKRELLAEALREAGHKVQEACDGQEAIEMVRVAQGELDFVVMDVVLLSPVTGMDAIRVIKEEYDKPKIIAVTAYGGGEESREALAAGAWRYVFRVDSDEDVLDLIRYAPELEGLDEKIKNMTQIMDDMAIPANIVDCTYRLLYANDKQREAVGYDCQLGGICWMELHHAFGQKEPCSWCPVAPLFETGKPTPKRAVIFRPDGKVRYYDTIASPAAFSQLDGRILAAMMISFDITERERMDSATLQAYTVDERLDSALGRIRMLGYSRVRLYELSEDGEVLIGRKEVGGIKIPIHDIRQPVKRYPYNEALFQGQYPIIQRKGKLGPIVFEAELEKEEIEEWLDVPLITWAGDLIGKVSTDNKPLGPFPPGQVPPPPKPLTDEHFDLLMDIGAFAANALMEERQQLTQRREAEMLRQLRKLDEELAKTYELDEDLRIIAEKALTLTAEYGVVGCHIRLLEEDKLIMRAGVGPHLKRWVHVRGEEAVDDPLSICASTIITQVPHIAHDTFSDPLWRQLHESVTDEELLTILKQVKSYAAFPIMADGQPLGAFVLLSERVGFVTPELSEMLLDLSDRAAREINRDRLLKELREVERRLSEVNRRVASAATHRFGAPVAALEGVLRRLRDILAERGQPDPDLQYLEGRLHSAVERLHSMVDEYKHFWDAHRLELQEVDLVQIVKGSLELGILEGRNIRCDLEDIPHIVADSAKINEAIGELLTNAARYTEEGDAVSVSLRIAAQQDLKQFDYDPSKEWIRIDVEDTGAGIPDELRGRVFEPYLTSDPHRIGLGLAIVKEIFTAHDGDILEISRPGQGAHFVVFLPLKLSSPLP